MEFGGGASRRKEEKRIEQAQNSSKNLMLILACNQAHCTFCSLLGDFGSIRFLSVSHSEGDEVTYNLATRPVPHSSCTILLFHWST